MKAKILHLDSNHPVLIQLLESKGFINDLDTQSDVPELAQKIAGYTGIVIRSRIRLDNKILEKAQNLKFIARVGIGLENIDTELAQRKGIAIINAPEGSRNAVAEHTLALLLNLTNNICKSHNQIQKGIWEREGNRGFELSGKTIGIIGYGNTGKSFAKKLHGFDVDVLYHDILKDLGVDYAKPASIQEIQEKAQILSLHIPITDDTYKMVDEHFIKAFKHSFYLINTARGKVVDTKALIHALKQEKILGAGLDVLEYEKSSFTSIERSEELDYLIQSDNVILTPHIAGWTHESNRKLAEVVCEKIFKLFNI